MSKSRRSTSVHAVRDSVLAQVPFSVHRLQFMSSVAVPRLQRKARASVGLIDSTDASPLSPRPKPRQIGPGTGRKLGTIAIVPISDHVPIAKFTAALVKMLREDSEHSILHLTKDAVVEAIGKAPSHCNADEYQEVLEWITRQEMVHSMVRAYAPCGTTFCPYRFSLWPSGSCCKLVLLCPPLCIGRIRG
jgi:hypothetical protein